MLRHPREGTRGVVTHGVAFAVWATYVGNTAGELLEDDAFRNHLDHE
jgi:hypothetical protein